MLLPADEWSAICPKTHRHFYLGFHPGVGSTPYSRYALIYPKGDMTEVEVVCPVCGDSHFFKNEDLLRPTSVRDIEVRERQQSQTTLEKERRLAELESKVKELEAAKEALEKAVRDQDDQIGKFADSFFSLSKFVHEKVGQKTPQEPEEDDISYEGPKT